MEPGKVLSACAISFELFIEAPLLERPFSIKYSTEPLNKFLAVANGYELYNVDYN